MSPNINEPAPVLDGIRRVRVRTHANGKVELHATLADRRRVDLPASGRYQSQSGWRSDGRAVWTEPIR